tara:strand:+ start:20926 stop:21096 length:171 start_codon:yes stop_codon:yes gene_type:complete
MTRLLIIGLILFSSHCIYSQKVFSVDYENQADLKIYFTDYENQAGWKKSSKKHLMY